MIKKKKNGLFTAIMVIMFKLLLFIYAIFLMPFLQAMERKDGVNLYDPIKDEQQIRRIALENIDHLVCPYAFDLSRNGQRAFACEHQVMDYFKRSPDTRVFLKNGLVTGFITYDITLPWYRQLFNSKIGGHAIIQHVAVDAKSRNKGYGKQLVQSVLADCTKQDVHYVHLWTGCSDEMAIFYKKKLGFEIVRWTHFGEYNYGKRLRPHPAIELLGYMKKFLRK